MDEPVCQRDPERVDGRKAWDSAQDKRGLECCNCGCRDFHAIYARHDRGGKLIRRRDCRDSGKRMTTWERPIGA